LTEPPRWEPGDWWTIEFTDPTPAADGATYTTTRIVAEADDETYLVGMPLEAFNDKILVWHMPGFGNVAPDTLGFLVHGEPFKPLDFPLEEGKTWQTSFLTDMTARVVDVSQGEATVEFTGSSPFAPGTNYTAMRLVYDAEQGVITQLESFPGPVAGSGVSHGSYEVVDHGDDYEGEVMVPENRREVFFSSRLAGVLGGPTPSDTAQVPDDVDRVTLAHVMGEVHDKGHTTGVYRETSITPGGDEIQSQVMPGTAPGRHVT